MNISGVSSHPDQPGNRRIDIANALFDPPLAVAAVCNRISLGNAGGAKLVDVDCAALADGSIAAVHSVGALFELQKAPTAAVLARVDGITIVASAATAGAVWTRLESAANERFGADPPVAIDPATGNDDNDGTALHPLASADEWSRRMDGTTITADLIEVACGAGNIGNLFGKIYVNNSNPATGCIVRFTGSKTLSSAMTITAVTAENSVTRQEYFFTKTGGPVLTGNERMRILTSGTASRVGSVGYAAGFEGGDPTHPYSSAWSSELAGFATNVFPGVGDTIAVETLTTEIRAFDLEWHSIGKYASHVELEDLYHNNTSGLPGFTATSNCAKVTVFGDHFIKRCQFIGASIFRLDGNRYWFRGCEFQCQVYATSDSAVGGGYAFYQSVFRANTILAAGVTQVGCAFEAIATINSFWSNGSDALFRRIMSGAGLVVGSRGLFATNTARVWSPPVGARNGTTYLIQVNPFGQVNSNTFAVISGSPGSVGAIIMNSRPVQNFTTDLEGQCAVNCTDSADGAINYLRSIAVAPAVNPALGGYLYVEAGALKYRGSSGTVTTLGAA